MGPAERAAHQYADAGWPVFPLLPGEKVPLPGSAGFKDATTGHRQIERAWSRNPERNVGIATGAPGPDVLDIDHHGGRGTGYPAWNQARQAGLTDGHKAIVRTPSGGMHAYYTGTSQRSAKVPARHVDFRAQGGYVVAPPSRAGGRPYEVVSHQPSDATVDFTAIRSLLDPQPERQPARLPAGRDGTPRDAGHLAGWVAALPEGNRNDGLFWAANRAIEAGDPAALEAIARAAEAAGLDAREVGRTIASAQRQHAAPRPFGGPREQEREAS